MAKGHGRRLLVVLLAVSLLLAAGAVFHRRLLSAAGEWLVAGDPLVKSDAALVLSGEDADGDRTRAGVWLYQHGWVKKLALSGAREAFGHYETDYSGPLALSLGVPEKDLLILTSRSRSTQEEAETTLAELQRAGVHSLILVTSNYHTRRARRFFRNVAGKIMPGQMQIIVYGARDEWFHPDSWWQTREGMKTFFFETMKTWTSALE